MGQRDVMKIYAHNHEPESMAKISLRVKGSNKSRLGAGEMTLDLTNCKQLAKVVFC